MPPKTKLIPIIVTLIATFGVLGLTAKTNAQRVSATISGREAYVGAPLKLEIKISNAQTFSPPDDFKIDGCDVRSGRAPFTSSQITIINGVRSQSRSTTLIYEIIPRREGTFEIPEIKLNVNGKIRSIESMTFIATKSETGDLLFAEITADKKKLYVGQPLDLTLKIWIKPFRTKDGRVRLDDGDMWRQVSQQTQWGQFLDAVQKLDNRRKRPVGQRVLRDNGQGQEREYYLYQIAATIYPTQSGAIAGDDVQICVNYPEELSRARDPFDSFFEDSLFSRRGFGSRLTISKTRPIIAEAKIDAIDILAIPTIGKPDDYLGAVGRYQIATQAGRKTVSAGDPITMRIEIQGDGPMSLVQAPPLHEIDSLTQDFKVVDQSLAGMVIDGKKQFVTTIRPRKSGITEIPPIPFSFFDPEKEAFETVYSEPIPITVNQSETLSLDSIVSNTGGSTAPDDQQTTSNTDSSTIANFQNSFGRETLISTSTPKHHWWYFAVIPPAIFLVTLIGKLVIGTLSITPSIRSAKSIAQSELSNANTPQATRAAFIEFIAAKLGSRQQPIDTETRAVGALRAAGLTQPANELETFFNHLQSVSSHSGTLDSNLTKTDSHWHTFNPTELLQKIDTAIREVNKHNIRRSKTKHQKTSKSHATSATMLLLAALIFPDFARADNSALDQEPASQQTTTVFEEANNAYRDGESQRSTDQAEATSLFTTAATKYQWLVDQGIQNAALFTNLGNAYLRSGQTGRAIANYHRALRLEPTNRQATKNLELATQQILQRQTDPTSDSQAATTTSRNLLAAASTVLRQISKMVVSFLGQQIVLIIFAVSSLTFWGLLTLKIVRLKIPAIRFSLLALPMMLLSAACLIASQPSSTHRAIIVADQIELRTGDGDEFAVTAKFEQTEGLDSKILNRRDQWIEITIAASSQSGWTKISNVELIDSPKPHR